jgi:hypothetical protein
MAEEKPYEITISVRGGKAGDEAVRYLEGPLEHPNAESVAADAVGHLDSRSRGKLKHVAGTDR